MGIYLNPKNDGFKRAIRSEIYVDKTGLIAYTNKYLNTEQQFICVSRPRRFGKSMALHMLAAYYSVGCDSRELFRGCKIEKDPTFAEYLNQFDVISLNMQQFLIGTKNQQVIEYLEQEVLEELFEEYGQFIKKPDIGLPDALRRIYTKTDKQFIFLIDEWDCIMRERQESEELQKQYLDSAQSAEGSALCGAGLYDRHSSCEKIWAAFRIEYVPGIFHDGSGFF